MVQFTQPVSMQVTHKQFNNDLREPLNALGYINDDITSFNSYNLLITNHGDNHNHVTNYSFDAKTTKGRYFIDYYNPELFLALAAMTNNKGWIKGEYLMFNDEIFKVLNVNEYGGENNYAKGSITASYSSYDRPSKEKLINHFTKKETVMNKPYMQNSLTRAQLLKLHEDFNCCTFRLAIEEILRTNILAHNDTKFFISDNAIQRLNKEGTAEQKIVITALGIILEKDKSVDCKDLFGSIYMSVKTGAEYTGQAFYLNDCYNWEIKKDTVDNLCLIPTKK